MLLTGKDLPCHAMVAAGGDEERVDCLLLARGGGGQRGGCCVGAGQGLRCGCRGDWSGTSHMAFRRSDCACASMPPTS